MFINISKTIDQIQLNTNNDIVYTIHNEITQQKINGQNVAIDLKRQRIFIKY